MSQPEIKPGRPEFPHRLTITHATFIRTDPSRIYNALTTAECLDAWFTSGSRVESHPGGEIFFNWVDWGPDHITTADKGLVLEAIQPNLFVFQWHPDLPEYATTVEINIYQVENGTIVRLREYGFADTASGYKAMISCAAGWGEALTLLKFYLEYGLRY